MNRFGLRDDQRDRSKDVPPVRAPTGSRREICPLPDRLGLTPVALARESHGMTSLQHTTGRTNRVMLGIEACRDGSGRLILGRRRCHCGDGRNNGAVAQRYKTQSRAAGTVSPIATIASMVIASW